LTTNTKIILGIQAANKGGKLPLVEKIVENLSVMMKRAAIMKPRAK